MPSSASTFYTSRSVTDIYGTGRVVGLSGPTVTIVSTSRLENIGTLSIRRTLIPCLIAANWTYALMGSKTTGKVSEKAQLALDARFRRTLRQEAQEESFDGDECGAAGASIRQENTSSRATPDPNSSEAPGEEEQKSPTAANASCPAREAGPPLAATNPVADISDDDNAGQDEARKSAEVQCIISREGNGGVSSAGDAAF